MFGGEVGQARLRVGRAGALWHDLHPFHRELLLGSTIWVCVTMAASLPSPRVMLVCSTMVVRPLCSGMQTARAVSPLGMGAKKLVLLSMVAVLWPSLRAALAVMPPKVSPQAITAPPCMTPRRLHRSSRTRSSDSVRSAVRLMIFTPISRVNGEGPDWSILVLILLSRGSHSTAEKRFVSVRIGPRTRAALPKWRPPCMLRACQT